MTAFRRPLVLVMLAAWAAAVAYLTLSPAGYTPPFTLRSFLCVGCGELDGSDIIRNWILFIPGGLLAASAFGPTRAMVMAACFTAGIEFVQIGVPGRDPGLQDLVFNTLGAFTGVVVMRRGIGRWGQRVLCAAAALAWLAPLVLLIPKTTPFDLYGLWTPRFGATARYEGRILDASLGRMRVESHILQDKPTLDSAITDRQPIRLVLEVAPSPSSRAPVFQIVDGYQKGILEIGALGPDLLLRGRNPARILRLDQPDARWQGAMLGLPVGDTVTLVVERGRDSVCMSIGDRERCRLAPSVGDGWGHVLNLEGPPAWFRAGMSLLWAIGLGGIMGLTATSRRNALAGGTTLAAVGYVAAHLSPDVRPDAIHAAVLGAGALVGALARSSAQRLWRAFRVT